LKAVNWEDILGHLIGYIEETDPKNPKLALVFSIRRLLSLLSTSIEGWRKWISSGVLDELEEDELEAIHDFMKEHTLTWLKFDRTWTETWRKRKPKRKISDRPDIYG